MKDDILLTDGAVSLRFFNMSDAEEMYKAVMESAAEFSSWLEFPHEDSTIKEIRKWLKIHPKNRKKSIEYDFAICDKQDGTFLGGCGLTIIDDANKYADLYYWIRTGCTSRGVATAAASLLAKWGFKELKLNRIEILVAIGNRSSLRVAEKVGAHREGVLRKRITLRGKVHDAVMFSLIPGDI